MLDVCVREDLHHVPESVIMKAVEVHTDHHRCFSTKLEDTRLEILGCLASEDPPDTVASSELVKTNMLKDIEEKIQFTYRNLSDCWMGDYLGGKRRSALRRHRQKVNNARG